MKYFAILVAVVFMLGGEFIPSVKASSDPIIQIKTLADAQPLNTKLQSTAKAEYTISFYQDYIFTHESGWRTDAINSIGCRGLGQACPGSKLPCGDHDFDCQFAWFNAYCLRNYGSWENAYNFWVQNKWW